MKALKLLAAILVLLMTSGCVASRGIVKDDQNKVMDVYMKALSSGRIDAASYIKENLKIDKAFGYTKPYLPVVIPADVRMVWVPTHKLKNSPEVLVIQPIPCLIKILQPLMMMAALITKLMLAASLSLTPYVCGLLKLPNVNAPNNH